MNSDFPRILTLLRKERGISQKQAATELAVSQALLSHYEKGIRECGLDFVVRAADFYQVSCDYLLGRSPERSGATLSLEDIPEPDAAGKENVMKNGGSMLPLLNKKLIFNSLNILFDLLQKINCKEVTNSVSEFMMLAVYRMFRALYGVNGKNEQSFFMLPKHLYTAKALSTMATIEAEMAGITEGIDNRSLIPGETRENIALTSESLAKDYPLFASSLLNLVKTSEQKMKQN